MRKEPHSLNWQTRPSCPHLHSSPPTSQFTIFALVTLTGRQGLALNLCLYTLPSTYNVLPTLTSWLNFYSSFKFQLKLIYSREYYLTAWSSIFVNWGGNPPLTLIWRWHYMLSVSDCSTQFHLAPGNPAGPIRTPKLVLCLAQRLYSIHPLRFTVVQMIEWISSGVHLPRFVWFRD